MKLIHEGIYKSFIEATEETKKITDDIKQNIHVNIKKLNDNEYRLKIFTSESKNDKNKEKI